jgi:hypothetical protein
MPAEPPPDPSRNRPAPAGAGARRVARPDPAALAAAERRLNSPTPLTLRLLGVVFAATFLPWVAAKAACNQRDSPIRQPHDLPTDVLAKNAKSAALELAQRAASGRYREAAELAHGDVAKELLGQDAQCQAQPAPCEHRRAEGSHVFTRVVVASRGPFDATVRSESRVGNDPPERFAMRLQQEDGRWYVVQRAPLAGEIDAPVLPEEMISPVAIREAPPGQGQGPLMSIAPQNPHAAPPHGLEPPSSASPEPKP